MLDPRRIKRSVVRIAGAPSRGRNDRAGLVLAAPVVLLEHA